MLRIPERSRPPVLIGVAGLVVLLLASAVILVPRLVPLAPSPAPSAAPSASPTGGTSTPESAARGFFSAFSRARQSNDPTIVLPFVTGETADAYRSVKGFLDGQREVGKASVITVERIENLKTDQTGAAASVMFDFTEGGYDISLDTGEPLESPMILPTRQVSVDVRQIDGQWLVDDYESAP